MATGHGPRKGIGEIQLSEVVKGVAAWASHLNTGVDILGIFRGAEPSEKAHAVVKGLHGVLGFGDEREIARLYSLLNKQEGYKNGSEKIAGFLRWLKKGREPILIWWYGNAFRTFVTKMGSSEGHSDGTQVTTVKTPAPGETDEEHKGKDHGQKKKGGQKHATGPSTTVVTTKELRGHGTNNGLEFLKWMVDTMGNDGEVGYQRLLDQFRAFGYPCIPEEVEFGETKAFALKTYNDAKTKLVADTEKQRLAYSRESRSVWNLFGLLDWL